MKPEMKLEKQADVFKLPLPKGDKLEVAYFDRGKPNVRAKGLALRVRSDGTRTWVFFYRNIAGKQKKLTIGPASDNPSGWTLDKARREAHAYRVAVDNHKDPVEERRKAEAAAEDSKTFKETAEAYLTARQRSLKWRSFYECSRHLNKEWKALHRFAVHEITTDIVADGLKDIEKASGPVTRNRARATLSAMFAWALGERFAKQLKTNPTIGTLKAEENGPRDRVLSYAEIAKIWKAAPDNLYGRVVKLLMLTGQRREEIGGLRWAEIDLEAKLITLPAARTKNGREHLLPLSKAAMEILKTCPHDHDRDLVFGVGSNGMGAWSKSKAALDAVCGVKNWTIHDLRRTVATRMADIGIQPHIIEAVLNHVSGHKAGVAGTYNRSTYAAEKRAALDLWASELDIAIRQANGENLTRLRKFG
jgi:integrase